MNEIDRQISIATSLSWDERYPRINDSHGELVTFLQRNPSYLVQHFERLFGMPCDVFLKSLHTDPKIDRIHELIYAVYPTGDFVRFCQERYGPASMGGITRCINDVCPICFDELETNEDIVQCQCKNCFHTKCIEIICAYPAPQRTCPMCRVQWKSSCTNLKRTKSYRKKRKLIERGGKSRRKKN